MRSDPTLTIGNLQRQFVYDRFLARVFNVSGEDWVLKGGSALLARVRSARHSQDLDLFRRSGTLHSAAAELEAAASADLADHFRFEARLKEIRSERAGQPGTELALLHVDAYVGVKRVGQFTVDVVVGGIVTAAAECIAPAPVVDLAGLTSPSYLLYPMVDHIADKVCATFELHPPGSTPSSRVRDLVDLVVIARTQAVGALSLRTALETERLHRGLPQIHGYVTPPNWETTYRRLARDVAECREHRTYAQAVEFVQSFLDPVLQGAVAVGSWDPNRRAWTA
ncbi:MAG: nucleotidyl transferase AbiEii/AbiGii toxin family protein [Jatrophihabitantaceae bacterium]